MNDIRLGDGAPVWEGAAITVEERRYWATGRPVEGTLVEFMWRGGPDVEVPSRCRLDLSHRPTFLELAARVAEAIGGTFGVEPGESVEFMWYNAGSVPSMREVRFDDPSALLDLWMQVDGKGVDRG